MGPVLAIIANILREATFPVAYSDCDDGVQEITPKTPYPTLRDPICQGLSKLGQTGFIVKDRTLWGLPVQQTNWQ